MGMISNTNHYSIIPGFGRSEVVIIYPDTWSIWDITVQHLVGGWPTPPKNMSSSVGIIIIIIPNIYMVESLVIKAMFQTTKQYYHAASSQ